METLCAPSIRLLRTHPWVVSYEAKLTCNTPTCNIREATIEHCHKIQNSLVGVTKTMLLMAVFGAAVPPLLVLAPAFIWLQGCAHHWMSEVGPQGSFFQMGEGSHLVACRVASQVLVQQPNVLVLVHCLSWLINGFVMYDLEFSIGDCCLLYL